MNRSAIIAAGAAALALFLPAVASAHDTTWVWSEASAEQALIDRYSDVDDARCDGFGRSYPPTRKGAHYRLYRHFDCASFLDDGTTDHDILHVTGRHTFRLTSE